ncbi:MAG: hypothetical protein KJP21_04615 [Bacteroidia bacterium]|nr:hypothetical protein [Bacteroidia bacterium]
MNQQNQQQGPSFDPSKTSVYQQITGGGGNVPNMLAVLDLGHTDFNPLEIHEAWVNIEERTVDFYVDDPTHGMTLHDCLTTPADNIRSTPIPSLVVVQYSFPQASEKVLEGLVKLIELDSEEGNISPCERYTSLVEQLKTRDPYEQHMKMKKVVEELQNRAQSYGQLKAVHKEGGLPELERNIPEDKANDVLPETILGKLNDELDKETKPNIITP